MYQQQMVIRNVNELSFKMTTGKKNTIKHDRNNGKTKKMLRKDQ